jgi:hypothetical protein
MLAGTDDMQNQFQMDRRTQGLLNVTEQHYGFMSPLESLKWESALMPDWNGVPLLALLEPGDFETLRCLQHLMVPAGRAMSNEPSQEVHQILAPIIMHRQGMAIGKSADKNPPLFTEETLRGPHNPSGSIHALDLAMHLGAEKHVDVAFELVDDD